MKNIILYICIAVSFTHTHRMMFAYYCAKESKTKHLTEDVLKKKIPFYKLVVHNDIQKFTFLKKL